MFYFLLLGLLLVIVWFHMTVKGGYRNCTLAAGCALALETPIMFTFLTDKKFWNAPIWNETFIILNLFFMGMAAVSLIRKHILNHHCPWDKH
jgi:hypothetical protein